MSEPIQFIAGDKTYMVGRFTKAVQSKFEAYLKGDAFRGLVKQKEHLGSEYAEALDQHVFDCAHDKFAFYGKNWWRAVQEPVHFNELLWLCLCTQQAVPRSVVSKLIQEYPQECLAIWKQLLEEDCAKKE
jgi:hypothetical protein